MPAPAENPVESLDNLAAQYSLTLLLIGAQALQELGVARQTFDLDLLIADVDRDLLAGLLRTEGYTPVAETENFQRFSHSDPDRLDIDVLFVDPATFEKLAAESTALPNGKNALRIPSLPHFIALKLHAIRNNPKREARDLGDIAELLRISPRALLGDQLEEICRVHGPEGVYSKLKELI